MDFKKVTTMNCAEMSDIEISFFNKFKTSYNDCIKTKLPNKLRSVFRAILKRPRGAMLDVGCGSGGYSSYFAQLGFKVTGVDLSESAIRCALKFTKELGISDVDFHAMDIRELSIGPFDLAYSFDVIEHIPWEDHERFIAAVYDKLNPGGVFFIRAPHAYNIRQQITGHIGLPTYKELMTVAKKVGYKAQVLVGHTGSASPVNYAIPLENFINTVAPSDYWRYTFMKYFSMANVVVQLTK